MSAILATKSLQTSVLAGLLFYVFANPGMYKIIRQFPGLKFVMNSATEITHAGTLVNAVLFGLVMLLCVHLINSALIKDHLKFLNVVENYSEKKERREKRKERREERREERKERLEGGGDDSGPMHDCVEKIWPHPGKTKGYPCDVALDGSTMQCVDGNGFCSPTLGPDIRCDISGELGAENHKYLLKNYEKCGCTKLPGGGSGTLDLYCHDA